jgi:molybdopterin/thiamine biosynthesis adenylyltransferase
MSKKLIIVGAGALGSHLVQLLRNLDVTITVMDFDRIEQKNIMSQFHSKPSVGKNKTVALAQTMNFLFGLKIESNPNKLTRDNANIVLNGHDLIVDCLDNAESRKIIQTFAREYHVPCIHGALAADGAFGRVVWDEDFIVDDESGAGTATCENGEHLPFINIVASFLAKSIQAFSVTGKKIGYNISPDTIMRF